MSKKNNKPTKNQEVITAPERPAVTPPPAKNPPSFVARHHNLASPMMGASILYASDDFFAPPVRMLQDHEPLFFPDKYDNHGKWMDGWETRRRRQGGHDHAIIKLGARGVIHGLGIHTHFFTGNFPPAVMVEGAIMPEQGKGDNDKTLEKNLAKIKWQPLLAKTNLQGDSYHFFTINTAHEFNVLRVSIFPDGGIARLRVYGEPKCDWQAKQNHKDIELSALKYGGRIIGYNDAHYGNVSSLLAERRAINMGDGWETRRQRNLPSHDWLVLALAHAGIIDKVVVDTAHYKGNYPDSCMIEGVMLKNNISDEELLKDEKINWQVLLPQVKLRADYIHTFDKKSLQAIGAISHARLKIFPDGGVSRLRLYGRLPA
ncbi:MAG: allantoicase [Hydrotalea sp.]|nr:allantoicase [Hydrotalea sp.]